MNGPAKIWDLLLTTAAATYGSAVIAGGAVRDWSINKNIRPRDIDVFVTVEDENDLGMGMRELLAGPYRDLRLMEPDVSGYGPGELESSNVEGVLEGFVYEDRVAKINVIGKSFDVYDSERLFQDFDHSLCEFSYSGEIITIGEAAQRTLDTGVIEVSSRSHRTKRRLTNLVGRGKSYERFTFADDFDPQPATKAELDWGALRAQYEHLVNAEPGVNIPIAPRRMEWVQMAAGPMGARLNIRENVAIDFEPRVNPVRWDHLLRP